MDFYIYFLNLDTGNIPKSTDKSLYTEINSSALKYFGKSDFKKMQKENSIRGSPKRLLVV